VTQARERRGIRTGRARPTGLPVDNPTGGTDGTPQHHVDRTRGDQPGDRRRPDGAAATRRMASAGMAIGLMLQPSSALELAAPSYGFWAADNGCFTRGDQFDPHRWFAWLAGLPDVGVRRRCLFAVAPDVLSDAEATWQRSWPWLELVRALGVPVALVAQNGVESHVATRDCDECWDVCFIGGDTDWKTSAEARAVAREAQLRGKWVHVGRVNSWKRINRVADWDVDSVDGTFLRFGPDTNGARLARWLQRLDTTPTLF